MTLEQILQIIILLYAAVNVILFFIIGGESLSHDDYTMFEMLPCDLHNHTNMNWVGCWCTSVVLFILIPSMYLARLIYFLFHIGNNSVKDRR